MPKYNFSCEKCKIESHAFVPAKVHTIKCPSCGAEMVRLLPNINSPTEVKEIVDPYLNKRLNKDHDLIMKERRRSHFLNVEIPRLIDTYSLETCLENGWLVYNDKGELVVNKNWIPSEKRKV